MNYNINNEWSIKSISFYYDQVVLLYGETDETTSVFLYRYKLSTQHIVNQANKPIIPPLFDLNFDHTSQVLERGPLVHLFVGAEEFVNKFDIVQLLFVHRNLVLMFFRDPHLNRFFYVTFLKRRKIFQNIVESVLAGHICNSVLLYHQKEQDTLTNVTNNSFKTVSTCKFSHIMIQ